MTEQESRKAFITKYALTKGIFQEDVFKTSREWDDLVRSGNGGFWNKGEYFFTEAISYVQNLIKSKLKSLDKQMTKLIHLKQSLSIQETYGRPDHYSRRSLHNPSL